jgi:hypothetical protein
MRFAGGLGASRERSMREQFSEAQKELHVLGVGLALMVGLLVGGSQGGGEQVTLRLTHR